MNDKQANKVKHLAPDVIKVLEGLEWECPTCKGTGKCPKDKFGLSGGYRYALPCPLCDGKKKIPYSWQPQVGEWLITPTGEVWLFTHKEDGDFWMRNVKGEKSYLTEWGMENQATPILPWETIEEILEKAGYLIQVCKESDKETDIIGCRIWNKVGFRYKAKIFFAPTRLPAVYEAVLALGKEIKCL